MTNGTGGEIAALAKLSLAASKDVAFRIQRANSIAEMEKL